MSVPLLQRWRGRVLGGVYQIESLLGEGGQGAVFRARHLRTDGLVAIKVLLGAVDGSSELTRRFQDEARVVSSLRHPNIIQIFDLADDDGTSYIAMELLDGEDLARRLEDVGTLPLEEVVNIAQQVASALQAVHARGIVHRDIKPHNLFLVNRQLPSGRSEIVKVLDFGICKFRRSLSLTPNATLLGTPNYMAPEAALGSSHSVDARADQYALAVVLYQALSGTLPFVSNEPLGVLFKIAHDTPLPLCALVPSLPPHVSDTIGRAMAKNPNDRFPSIIEFARALVPLGDSDLKKKSSPSFPGPSQAEGLTQKTRRVSMRATLAVLIGGVFAVVGAGSYRRSLGAERESLLSELLVGAPWHPACRDAGPADEAPDASRQAPLQRDIASSQSRETQDHGVSAHPVQPGSPATGKSGEKKTAPGSARQPERERGGTHGPPPAAAPDRANPKKRIEVPFEDIFD